MRKISLVFLFVILYAPAYGSSIIVVRTNEEIVIATDSKRLKAAREDLSNAQSELVCKIARADHIFIASAGIAGVLSSDQAKIPEEFDLMGIMNKAALVEGSIEDKAGAVAKAAEGALLRIVSWSKKKMPAFFDKMFTSKQVLQVVLAGFEKRSPVIIIMAFEPLFSQSDEVEIKVETRPCPGIACPSGFVYIFMGRHEAIDRYLSADQGIWKNNPVEVVRELMEIEVTSERETIGLPVDILRITEEGSEWMQKKDICEDTPRVN